MSVQNKEKTISRRNKNKNFCGAEAEVRMTHASSTFIFYLKYYSQMAFLGSSDNIELDLNLSSLKCSTLLFSIAPGREDLNTDNNTKNMSGKGR